MNYVGVDIHKKYSVLCALDESGRKLREGRVEGNAANGFAQFFAGLNGPSKAVVEACWNWGLIHDELEELDQVEEVVLAHPHKTRLIAEAQIKPIGSTRTHLPCVPNSDTGRQEKNDHGSAKLT